MTTITRSHVLSSGNAVTITLRYSSERKEVVGRIECLNPGSGQDFKEATVLIKQLCQQHFRFTATSCHEAQPQTERIQ